MAHPGAPAAEEGAKKNSACYVPMGTELDELDFLPGCDEVHSVFYTFEGRARCGDCGQLWLITGNHRDCPSVLPKVVSSLCDSCGMPFAGGLAGRSKKKRHHGRCRGDSVRAGWQPASDGTLHCPLCKKPGFNHESLDAHLTTEGKACDGNRKSQLFDEEKKLTGRGWKVFCQGCGYTFHSLNSFARHVCGSPHDPIWLGKTTHPNTSKPYVVWCHEDASPNDPVGYGGGQIAGDEDAAIPQAVRDASWGIPFSTYAYPRPDSVAQYLEDAQSLMRLVRRRLVGEVAGVSDEGDDEEEEEDDDDDDDAAIGMLETNMPLVAGRLKQYLGNLNAELNALVGDVPHDQALPIKHQHVGQELARELEKKNRSLLERASISVQALRGHECPGYSFVHGHIPCPYGASLDLGSVRVHFRPDRSTLLWTPVCFRCEKGALRLHRWQNRCKFNRDGSRLCTVNDCREPLVDSLDCEEHARVRLERRLRAARRHARPGSQHRLGLWKIVSPADMRQWMSDLGPIRAYYDNDPVWADVSRALRASPAGGKGVYVVDTETILEVAGEDQPRQPLVLELAVVDASGATRLNTTIQHGDKKISAICEGQMEAMVAYACRIYGAPDASHKTKGMLPDDAKGRLVALGLDKSLMVEWSTSGWDWRAMRRTFGEQAVPQTYLRGTDLLRMAGYRGPMDLVTLFHLLFLDSPLNKRHHRALIDAQKLLLVLKYVLTGDRSLVLGMGGGEA